MNSFPSLNTGAVTQYPTTSATAFFNQVLQFIDGSEQRYPARARSLKRWNIQLDLLDEDETSRLIEFFAGLSGPAGSFSFTDPATGTIYLDCSFEADDFSMHIRVGNRGATTFSIRENQS